MPPNWEEQDTIEDEFVEDIEDFEDTDFGRKIRAAPPVPQQIQQQIPQTMAAMDRDELVEPFEEDMGSPLSFGQDPFTGLGQRSRPRSQPPAAAVSQGDAAQATRDALEDEFGNGDEHDNFRDALPRTMSGYRPRSRVDTSVSDEEAMDEASLMGYSLDDSTADQRYRYEETPARRQELIDAARQEAAAALQARKDAEADRAAQARKDAQARRDAQAAKAARDAKAATDAEAAAAKAAADAQAAKDAADAAREADPYRAGLMAETATTTGAAPITGYNPFNMPTAGQTSQFDPAYGGLMSRLGGQQELGAGPAPGGGFGGEPVAPLPPPTPPPVIPLPPPPVIPPPPAPPLAHGGLVDPSMIPAESNEEIPVEIIEVAMAAISGEMPAAQASQILVEIQKLFPGLVEEITNQVRIQKMKEGGADSLVSEGFLPPYPDNGPQGNGRVDDTLAIGGDINSPDFEEDFQKRLAGGGPLPVRALLAGGEYIVNAGDAEAGRQELIDAAEGVDPRIPPGAAVWDDFVGNINR